MGQEPLTGPSTAPRTGAAAPDPGLRPDPGSQPDSGQPRDPEAIRRDIAGTRQDMDRTLDEIEDRVSPRRIAERRTDKVRDRWTRVREGVMGSAEDAKHRVGGSGGDTGQGVAERARQAPHTVERQTRGNPLAAGLIAFGAGLLAASALPKTQAEQQAAQRATEQLQPLREQLTEAGKDVASRVQEHAKDAAQHTTDTAKDAAATVQDEAKGSAEQLRDEGQQRSSSVKDQATS